MKLLLCYVVILSGAFVAASIRPTRVTRGPSESLRKMLENIKKQMPCGFPEYGVPPLAPFKEDNIEIELDESFAVGYIYLNDLRVDGLDKFDIIDISFNVLTLKSTFDINFKEISSLGQYKLDIDVPETMKLYGKGNLDIKLKDLRIKGNLKMGAKLSGVQLKDFNVIVSLGGVEANNSGLAGGGLISEMLNKILEKLVMDIVKEQQKLISQKIYDMVVPQANNILKQYSLADIIRMVTKPPGEPKECIPPPELELLRDDYPIGVLMT